MEFPGAPVPPGRNFGVRRSLCSSGSMQGLIRTRAARAGAMIVALVCVMLLVLLTREEPSRAASSRPNVIMFTTDDQTVRDLAFMPKTQALIANPGASF